MRNVILPVYRVLVELDVQRLVAVIDPLPLVRVVVVFGKLIVARSLMLSPILNRFGNRSCRLTL